MPPFRRGLRDLIFATKNNLISPGEAFTGYQGLREQRQMQRQGLPPSQALSTIFDLAGKANVSPGDLAGLTPFLGVKPRQAEALSAMLSTIPSQQDGDTPTWTPVHSQMLAMRIQEELQAAEASGQPVDPQAIFDTILQEDVTDNGADYINAVFPQWQATFDAVMKDYGKTGGGQTAGAPGFDPAGLAALTGFSARPALLKSQPQLFGRKVPFTRMLTKPGLVNRGATSLLSRATPSFSDIGKFTNTSSLRPVSGVGAMIDVNPLVQSLLEVDELRDANPELGYMDALRQVAAERPPAFGEQGGPGFFDIIKSSPAWRVGSWINPFG